MENDLKSFKNFYNNSPKTSVPTDNGNTIPKKLSDDVVEILDARIGDEYAAHYFYRNAANWCKNVNFNKAAAYFENEAKSELEHAKGLQDYLTQWNVLPAIPQAPTKLDFDNLIDIIRKAYEMEYNLLQKYSGDQKVFANEHPATFNFIQNYVNIQNESVGEYSDLLNAVELIDSGNKLDVLFFEKNYF